MRAKAGVSPPPLESFPAFTDTRFILARPLSIATVSPLAGKCLGASELVMSGSERVDSSSGGEGGEREGRRTSG